MNLLIQQDDGQLIPYTQTNYGWSSPRYGHKTLNSVVIDRNGTVLGIRDPEGKPVPMSNLIRDNAQQMISGDLYGLKRGNPDLFNSVDQLRTRRSADRNSHNLYAVGSIYAPDTSPTTFIEDGSGALAPGKPTPDQPPVYDGFGGIKARREAMESSEENPQPQAPVKSAGKFRKVRKGRSSGNLSRSGGNTYASAGIPRGGVVSPATMMRTSGVPPVQAAYGNNAPMGEGFDYTLTYDPRSSSMKPNNPYSYYDPSRNAPSGGDGTDLTLTYDPMTGQMVRR